MQSKLRAAFVTIILVVVAGLAAPAMAQQQGSGPEDSKPCHTPAAAVAGALIGALLGGKKHRAAGAAVGGALGAAACVAVNYRARQVKTAQQVAQDFQSKNGGLPAHSTAVRYDTRFDPVNRIQPGGSSSLDSYIEVVPGADGVQPTVEEEITLVGPDGKQIKSVRKSANQTASAGAFETQFAFTLPRGVPEGVYQFKCTLLLNGQSAGESTQALQVVSDAGSMAAVRPALGLLKRAA
jgi:hypothetical protein